MTMLNTLKERPEYGILTSFIASLLDHQHLWSLIGVFLGVLIGVVTLILKIIELFEKIKRVKKS